jgi:Ran GTPase-activating protein (RanGAP) involved in mRNA processing and transport
MTDLATLYRKQDMRLRHLDISSNNINSDGLYELFVLLKTNIRVKSVNLSRNNVCTDLKKFRMLHRFLLCNKTLESLNLSYCNIKEKGIQVIAKGLKGNRHLQKLNLSGNVVKLAVEDIAQAFIQNTTALCLKELDMSKTQIDSDHITGSFYSMLKSEFCTLKVLNLRDNFIKQA